MGIIGLLQVLFIGLKLTNFITWYWWTVFSPALVFIAIVVISSIAALIVMEHEINNQILSKITKKKVDTDTRGRSL